jgi:hypothetical protein
MMRQICRIFLEQLHGEVYPAAERQIAHPIPKLAGNRVRKREEPDEKDPVRFDDSFIKVDKAT